MPKSGIGALEFMKERPTWDGRGVVIAILDSGVDPGAAGLQVTTDSKPKILDVLDCTGSGDVDMSTVVKADEEGFVTGVFGEKLRVNPTWTNPSGDWRVGAKHASELWPGLLVRRRREHRRRTAAAEQRAAVAAATAALAAWDARFVSGKGTAGAPAAARKEREELEARLALLGDLDKGHVDHGPLLQGDPPGLLANCQPMTNFRAELQYGTFSGEDACSYAINIYDEGSVLSIVVDAHPHGTHMAGIAAAHHPEAPELDGIAPGAAQCAQIISCKIGDSRLGSMETGVGLSRALVAVLAAKADLVNMSYGEATSTPNAGRLVELITEVVEKHGVIFVIGTDVTPALAAAGHSVREALDEAMQYTWSSRGPCSDGHVGVVLSAPGGATAPVPQWRPQTALARTPQR
ncbi:hypothetical protein WJX81_007532 [Elliptochloris bilobata]|uniref:Peptidase S8/S53 domain-containing protein n=1 Tax=Elliptochloris bilobata TaxID=381761 RepID=A0AAW1QDC9_9CHLO